MRKLSLYLLAIAAVLATACQKYLPSDEHSTDDGNSDITIDRDGHQQWAVMRTDSGQLWMHEILAIGTVAELQEVDMPDEWRLPTRVEAQYLRTLTADNKSYRVLCEDTDGTLYSFAMPSASVIRAGTQTLYALRPVHLQRSFTITIDGEWKDTIYYNGY